MEEKESKKEEFYKFRGLDYGKFTPGVLDYEETELEWQWISEYVQEEKAKIAALNTSKVNRVEVIDENGKSYVNWQDHNKVELSFQDDGRTLKIFINR